MPNLLDTQALHPFYPRSHLFTVRLWSEEVGNGQSEMRMQVKHVLSGETLYFREWGSFITYLAAKMQEFNPGKLERGVDSEA